MPASSRRHCLDQLLERNTGRIAESVGDVQWPADGRHISLRPVNAHGFKTGGKETARRDGSFGHVSPVFVARADNATAPNAAAAYQQRPAVRPVIAPGFRIDRG